MSQETDIQWCDSTVNPIMGCGGCELYKTPGEICKAIDEALRRLGKTIDSKSVFKALVSEAYGLIKNPGKGHKKIVNTTNIWHLRKRFKKRLREQHGMAAAQEAERIIIHSTTCYAAIQHLNKGASLIAPERKLNKGYASHFEAVTPYEGRVEKMAKSRDLLGTTDPSAPWKDNLPRMIFVSDMGDAFSNKGNFEFLRKETIPHFQSEQGKRHLWLWLTKRPEIMAEFSETIGCFPENVCAMTTMTCGDETNLNRVEDLRKVKASIRGLSIEPLRERLDPRKLNLKGIDWVIVGGESGSQERTPAFNLEWAEELLELCKRTGVAFFLKQIGTRPKRKNEWIEVSDEHGGNWSEWISIPKVREFPKAFHDYRKLELKPSPLPRTGSVRVAPKPAKLSEEDQAEFKDKHQIVMRGIKASLEAGEALRVIQMKKLWRAGNFRTWEDSCLKVAGISKSYASRLVKSAAVAIDPKEKLQLNDGPSETLPLSESQVRPLFALQKADEKVLAWKGAVEKAGGSQPSAKQVQEVVIEILSSERGEPAAKNTDEGRERSCKAKDLVAELRELVRAKSDLKRIEEAFDELDYLLS